MARRIFGLLVVGILISRMLRIDSAFPAAAPAW
jgi:hypothetical protein